MLRLMAASAAAQLKVICTLRHQEIGNLFGVCKELRSTVRLPHSHVTNRSGPHKHPNAAPQTSILPLLLWGVCFKVTPLTLQMDTAMMLHFNVLTPHHDHASEADSAQGQPPRPAKRNGSFTPSVDPASSADWYNFALSLTTMHGTGLRRHRPLPSE